MEDGLDQLAPPDGPADARRREAGPPPDFALVRPFVASIGPDGQSPGGYASRVTADSPDVTQELHLPLIAAMEPPRAGSSASDRRSRTVPMIALAAIVCAATAGGVYALSNSNGSSNILFPHRTDVTIPAAPARAPSGAPSPTDTASSHSRLHTPRGSSAPSAPIPSPTPAITFAGAQAPPPSPSPAPPPFAPLPVAAVTGQITGLDGMCIDDNGRVTPNGNPIQVYGCNGTPAQAWTVQPDATLQVLGKCLEVTAPTAGGRTELWDCDGDATQIWRSGAGGSLVEVASGLCLDVPGASSQWGTQLDLAPCTGAAEQAWTLPQ
jgi:hypothetical protein